MGGAVAKRRPHIQRLQLQISFHHQGALWLLRLQLLESTHLWWRARGPCTVIVVVGVWWFQCGHWFSRYFLFIKNIWSDSTCYFVCLVGLLIHENRFQCKQTLFTMDPHGILTRGQRTPGSKWGHDDEPGSFSGLKLWRVDPPAGGSMQRLELRKVSQKVVVLKWAPATMWSYVIKWVCRKSRLWSSSSGFTHNSHWTFTLTQCESAWFNIWTQCLHSSLCSSWI